MIWRVRARNWFLVTVTRRRASFIANQSANASLLRERRRELVDQRIAEADDAAPRGEGDVAESSAVVAGETLRSR
jgi:hypothetical protein